MAPTALFSVLLAGCVFCTSLAFLESLMLDVRALKDVLGRNMVTSGRGEFRPRSPLNSPGIDDLLSEVYNLEKAPFGPNKLGVTFGNQSCQAPIASAYLMLREDGCWKWNVFFRELLLMWHKGKTEIDMIHKDGTYERVCLGDTLEDKDCKYVVHVPAGTKMFPRTEEHTITSGIVLGGHGSDGKPVTFDEMESEYAGTTMNQVIQETKSCYMDSNQ